MHYIDLFINFILHLNVHLATFMDNYGPWAYAILFLIIFCETGLVITPFLPGDTLLFAAGALGATGIIDIKILIPLLALGAILGDQSNYWIGRSLGHLLVNRKDTWYFKKSYIDKTHAFYARWGGKTLVIARFVPILRTFAPFVAGLGKMFYPRFCFFSITGGIFWITSVTYCGYLFGNIGFIKQNFTWIVFLIIIISISPAIFEFIRVKFTKKPQNS